MISVISPGVFGAVAERLSDVVEPRRRCRVHSIGCSTGRSASSICLTTELVSRGQHREVAVPDLMVAAIADVEGIAVLHHDADFDLIAAITGQVTEWIVEPDKI